MNIALVVAWLVPITTPIITAAFLGAYILSFIAGLAGSRNKLAVNALP